MWLIYCFIAYQFLWSNCYFCMEGGICPENVPQVLSSVQSLSHVQLCDPMNRSTPGLPVHHQLPESTQTHVY